MSKDQLNLPLEPIDLADIWRLKLLNFDQLLVVLGDDIDRLYPGQFAGIYHDRFDSFNGRDGKTIAIDEHSGRRLYTTSVNILTAIGVGTSFRRVDTSSVHWQPDRFVLAARHACASIVDKFKYKSHPNVLAITIDDMFSMTDHQVIACTFLRIAVRHNNDWPAVRTKAGELI